MVKIGAVLFLFVATGAFAAQPSTQSPSVQSQVKHYRLTFVLTGSGKQQAPQTFTLDIPVSSEHRGMAQTSTGAMLTEEPQSAVQETLQCTDVEESSMGLTARVAFSMDSTAKPLSSSSEPIHSNLTFNRLIDVKLNTPTVITEPMRRMQLQQGRAIPVQDDSQLPAPQITVTATEI